MPTEITLSPRECKELRNLERELKTSTLPDAVKGRVPNALEGAISEFRSRPANRDGRGVKATQATFILRTTRRVVLAVRHSEGHEDGNIRRQARRAVRACQHLPLDKIAENLKDLHAQLQRSGHRRKVEAERLGARRLHVGENTDLVEVVTSADLASVGRKLDLCVAHPRSSDGKGFHDDLRGGRSKFYVIEHEANPLGLIEVDIRSDEEVAAISAPGNEPFKFKRRFALEILRALGATADYVWAFARCGAFSPYVSGERPVDAGTIEEGGLGRRFRFTAFPDQQMLVVKEQRPRRRRKGHPTCRWSLFKRETVAGSGLAEWSDVSASRKGLSEGQFLELMCRAPGLAKKIGRLFR